MTRIGKLRWESPRDSALLPYPADELITDEPAKMRHIVAVATRLWRVPANVAQLRGYNITLAVGSFPPQT
jgi:hypothetical protein